MATSGLPVPKAREARSQAPGLIDGDRFSTATSWNRIASAGASLAESGFTLMKLEMHREQVGYFADVSARAKIRAKELRAQFADNPAAFDAAWRGETDGVLGNAPPWAVQHLRTVYGREGANNHAVILQRAAKKNQEKSRQGAFNFLNESGAEVAELAAEGDLQSPRGVDAVAATNIAAGAAVDAGLITQAESDDVLGKIARNAGRASTVRAVRDAFAEGGRETAQGLLNTIGEDVAGRDAIVQRATEEVESLEAVRDNAPILAARERINVENARGMEAFTLLGQNKLDDAWLDRYGEEMQSTQVSALRLALTALPSERANPAELTGLLSSAPDDPSGTLDAALDGFLSGQLRRQDLQRVILTASQVEKDAARPWANDLRRLVAERVAPFGQRRAGAITEVSDWLAANPNATAAEGREMANAIVEQHAMEDRRALRATLPLPRLAATRSQVSPESVAVWRQRNLTDAQAGRITLAQFTSEHRKLSDWDEAFAEST